MCDVGWYVSVCVNSVDIDSMVDRVFVLFFLFFCFV